MTAGAEQRPLAAEHQILGAAAILLIDQPHHIRFVCTSYQDGQFQPALDYHELIEVVLGL